jgi:hypothetical protein
VNTAMMTTDRTPQVDKKYIMPRYRGTDKDYILYGGLLDAAHKMGLAGITTTLVQIPSDLNKNIAIVHATVSMPWGEFSGLGDCDANEPRSMVAKTATIRMAETRAKARALRDAINANEFEVDDDLARIVDQETGEITTPTDKKDDRRAAPRPVPTATPEQMRASQRAPVRDPDDTPHASDPAGRTAENQPQRLWNNLVKECLESGHFTVDAADHRATGRPMLPSLSDAQWANATDIITLGRKLRADLEEFKGKDSSGA